MKAAIIEKLGKVTVREISRPNLGYGEVLIRVRVTGMCGAEIHTYHGTHPYRVPPVISGHELAGDIEAIGDGVRKFSVGDRMTVEPHIACRRGDMQDFHDLEIPPENIKIMVEAFRMFERY